MFVLDIQSSAEFVGTARLFTSALARHFRFEEAAVHDLKLAVSEACTAAIRSRAEPGPTPVRLRAEAEGDALSFEVEGGGALLPAGARLDDDMDAVAGTSTEDLIRNLRVEVIRALFPDVQVMDGPDGTRNIRFTCRIGDDRGGDERPAD